MTIAHARPQSQTRITGTTWTSHVDDHQNLRISLTIGYDEFILTEQEWKSLASIANQALALFAQPLSPEIELALRTNVLTIDP